MAGTLTLNVSASSSATPSTSTVQITEALSLVGGQITQTGGAVQKGTFVCTGSLVKLYDYTVTTVFNNTLGSCLIKNLQISTTAILVSFDNSTTPISIPPGGCAYLPMSASIDIYVKGSGATAEYILFEA